MHAQRLAAALTAALLLPLGACADSESKADPPAPTSSAPSPSKSATDGPTLPPAAQGTDEAAAKAFVRFYFELISEAMVTGDSAELRAFTGKTCDSCLNIAKRVDRLKASEATVKTRGWDPTKFIPGQKLDNGFEFYLRVRSHRRSLFEDDELIDRDPATTLTMRVVAAPHKGSWRVIWLDQLS